MVAFDQGLHMNLTLKTIYYNYSLTVLLLTGEMFNVFFVVGMLLIWGGVIKSQGLNIIIIGAMLSSVFCSQNYYYYYFSNISDNIFLNYGIQTRHDNRLPHDIYYAPTHFMNDLDLHARPQWLGRGKQILALNYLDNLSMLGSILFHITLTWKIFIWLVFFFPSPCVFFVGYSGRRN